MDLPQILISDYEDDPPVTMRYIYGDNELDLEIVYGNISRLCDHPGRGRLEVGSAPNGVPTFHLKECGQDFLDAFWNCAKNLCDYFADFRASDTAVMQSTWFHMLDKLKQAAILPHEFWLLGMPSCNHSQDFIQDCEFVQEIINGLVVPRNTGLSESIVSPNHLHNARLNVDLGDNKDGLKPWQQFLYKDSPGFAVPATERVYSNATQNAPDLTKFEVHIPRGGLALVDRHTKRLRTLAEGISQGESDTHIEARSLADFDGKTLDLKHVSTYTSIDGRQVLTQPMYPKPESERAPRRLRTLFDPSFLFPKPTLHLVNECVGVHKGGEVFQHGDDDWRFHMLSFGSPDILQSRSSQSKIDRVAYSDMFDDWATTT